MILLLVKCEGSAGDAVERTVILAVSYFVSRSAPRRTHKDTHSIAKVPAVILDYMLLDAD